MAWSTAFIRSLLHESYFSSNSTYSVHPLGGALDDVLVGPRLAVPEETLFWI